MHLIGSHGILYVQVPQMDLNLIFSCDGWNLIDLVPALRFRDLTDLGRAIASENWSKNKIVEYLSLQQFHINIKRNSVMATEEDEHKLKQSWISLIILNSKAQAFLFPIKIIYALRLDMCCKF